MSCYTNLNNSGGDSQSSS